MKPDNGVMHITTLGVTNGNRSSGQPFGIKQADRLFHLFLVGQTGTGKSTLIASMIRQDMLAGHGFCLLDPHGDLSELVMEQAGAQVRYWNAADPRCPFGFNPLVMKTGSPAARALIASGLIDTLKKQWPDAWGARMEHLLRFALLALLERPGSSIADIIPLFLDKEFREEVISGVTSEVVRRFWNVEYRALKYQSSADGVASIANKLGAFLSHPTVSKAVCDPDKPLAFREMMDAGRGLVVNLAKGRLGADISNLLGGLVVSAIANAAYSRQDAPEAKRRPFFLYIDECHSFTTSAFADMLSELRKYGLSVTASTQFTNRLGPNVREAVFGNVGTIVSFRVGVTDATLLAKQFGDGFPLPRDLTNLGNFETFTKLLVDGVQTKAFSSRTLPII